MVRGGAMKLEARKNISKMQDLMSIGNFATLAGVHVKSLHYYEKIGILCPAYVDPSTRYRYYKFQQINTLYAIQSCLELGIPLKSFGQFVSRENNELLVLEMVRCANDILDKRTKELEKIRSSLSTMQGDIDRAQKWECGVESMISHSSGDICMISPFSGKINDIEFCEAINNMFNRTKSLGLDVTYDLGVMQIFEAGSEKKYAFISLSGGIDQNLPDIITIPPTPFFCKLTKDEGMDEVKVLFKGLLMLDYKKYVIKREMFPAVYDYSNPKFEIRCSLPVPQE